MKLKKEPVLIAIEGMDFYAHHGCFKEETIIGTNFRADVYLKIDASRAENEDVLEGTLNYVEVYNRVKTQMMIPSKLIEHVAARIRNVLMEDFPQIIWLRIKIAKLNPPIGEKIREVNVSMEAQRES